MSGFTSNLSNLPPGVSNADIERQGGELSGAEAMYNALHVITDDPRISGWLVKHDPMALTQAREALRLYAEEVEPPVDEHCESDGSGTCLVHFGRLVDSDPRVEWDEASLSYIGGPRLAQDVCDLSPLR